MEDLRIGDKLFNWRYGAMTVTKADGDYIYLSVDTPNGVVGAGTWPFSTRCDQKVFSTSSLEHWIHRNPSCAIVENDNNFDHTFQDMRLPVDDSLLHERLRPIAKYGPAEVKAAIELMKECDNAEDAVNTARHDLKKRMAELERVKRAERDYPDHEAYHEALANAESSTEEARARVERMESESPECRARFDEAVGDLSQPLRLLYSKA